MGVLFKNSVSSVQSLSRVRLFATPWTAAGQHAPQGMHMLQRDRPPCPSPTPRACPNSCASSWWCHPTVSSSVSPSPPPAFNLSQHQDLFQWVSSAHQVAKVLELQLQRQSFQWIFRTDFLQDWLVWSCSPRDSRSFLQHHNSKASILQCSTFFIAQLSYPYMTNGKTIALTICYQSSISAF